MCIEHWEAQIAGREEKLFFVPKVCLAILPDVALGSDKDSGIEQLLPVQFRQATNDASKDSNHRPWCLSLAISRRVTGRHNVFHGGSYTNPRLQARVLQARPEMATTLIAQIVRFARPNIQIYDAHVVDLYQWVCARYLVGVKSAETKASTVKLGSRPYFRTDSRTLSPQKSTIEKQKLTLYFNKIWRRGSQSIPIERQSIFDFSRPKPTI